MKILKEEEQDLELDTEGGFDIYNYVTETTYNDRPFYIVYWSEIRSDYGFSNEEVDEILDDTLGAGNWGDSESYCTCDNCYTAIYTEDIYRHDYFVGDGYIICGDCVRKEPTDYLKYLTNNSDETNQLLDDESAFIDNGYKIYVTFDYNNKPRSSYKRHELLYEFFEEHPNGEFIFDDCTDGSYADMKIWVKISSL